MFQNLDPKELYTLQVIGSMQVSVKRMNKEGNTGFIVLHLSAISINGSSFSFSVYFNSTKRYPLGDISLSTGRIEISQQEYDFLKNETQQVQTIALSVSMGISALLNLSLLAVVCALTVVMCMKKKRYAELNRN